MTQKEDNYNGCNLKKYKENNKLIKRLIFEFAVSVKYRMLYLECIGSNDEI